MNKEVIYLEPEDDITDILTKLQQAEQKLVALVPPKKATMLRSAVNMKLVARVAHECEKVVVIVTGDPAIVKMAMLARIPVAKTLNSRPVVPTKDNIPATSEDEQVISEADLGEEVVNKPKKSLRAAAMALAGARGNKETTPEATEGTSDASSEKSANVYDIDDKSLEKASGDPKKAKKPAKERKKPASGSFMTKYGKWIKIGVPAVVVLAVVLIWAFVFAPAATIKVSISSSSENFSESIRFTTDPAAEDIPSGVFYAKREEIQSKYTSDVEATGEEDRGDHASGKVTVSFSFTPKDYEDGLSVGVSAGEVFIAGSGGRYLADESVDLSWNGEFPISCSNTTVTNPRTTCVLSATVGVTAAEAGDDYNLSSGASWKDFGNLSVSNSSAITGGTSDMVKVVSEEDLNKVAKKLVSEHESEGREDLFADVAETAIAIESSFKAEATDKTSTPAVGDAVGDNTTPSASITVTYSAYTVDKSKVEEFIKAKTHLSDGQQIYAISNPYFDRFTAIEDTARVKAVVESGPTVSEDMIFERVSGRKTGEVQSQLRSISGISSVDIRTSFFWVSSVPSDRSKVTIEIEGAHPAPEASSDADDKPSDSKDNAPDNNVHSGADFGGGDQ